LLFKKIASYVLDVFVAPDNLSSSTSHGFTPNLKFKPDANYILLYAGFLKNENELDLGKIPALDLFPDSDIFLCFNVSNPEQIRTNISTEHFYTRKNKGRDLGILRDFLRSCPKDYNRPLLVLNSSCHWDYKKMDKIVENLLTVKNEIVFGTISFQHFLHAQTFFIWVPSIHMPQFKEICTGEKYIKNWKTKRATVRYGEKLLLRKLVDSGIEASVLFHPLEFFNEHEARGKNISIAAADQLIERGSPFLKKSSKISYIELLEGRENSDLVTSRKKLFPGDY
jgi:hypothetical protein